MDRLDAMSMLLATIRHGSLSGAARDLKVSLPTLSRRISELEARLGARLLIRTTRKVTVTDAGAAYAEAARSILDQVTEAEREAAGEFVEPVGELVVTAPLMFGNLHVLPVVTDFLERYPAIRVRLVLADLNLRLVDENVDAAVRIGELPDSALASTRLGSVRTVLCGSPGLVDALGEPRSLDDLGRYPMIAVSAPVAMAQWRFRLGDGADTHALSMAPRLTVTTPEAAATAAARGAGLVQLLHYQVAGMVEAGRLRILLKDIEPRPAPVHLLHAHRPPLPIKLRRFLDVAGPALRRDLARLAAPSR